MAHGEGSTTSETQSEALPTGHETGQSQRGEFTVLNFFFRLLPSGVTTADFTSPVVPNFCILLRHFNLSHVLSHRIHKPPSRPSPFPLFWQFHPQHRYFNIPIIFPPVHVRTISVLPLVFSLQTVLSALSL